MQTYYIYDPVTFEYAGKVQCKNQPVGSTTSAPVAVLNGKAYELLKPIYDKETDTWHGTNSAYDLQKSVSGLSKQVANLNETVDLITQALSGNAGNQSSTTPISPDGKEVQTNV